MRVAEVIGKVTLSKWHPSLKGTTWLVGVPLSLQGIKGDRAGCGEPYVIYDERNAGTGAWVAVSEGAEASAPFHPDQKPIDAYNAAILDDVTVDEEMF